MYRHLLALLIAVAAAPAAQAEKLPAQRSELSRGPLRLQISDLTPRFMKFYDAAQGAEGDARFHLWQEHYDFAAVPPGPQGEQIARRLLDGAWGRYGPVLGDLRTGAARLGPQALDTLARIARVLDVRDPTTIGLTTYVGAFDNNAFTSRNRDGIPTVYFASETAPDRRRIILPHEMTHALHLKLADMKGGWERTIGATLLMEGLAVHVTREVAPGLPQREYIEYTPGWWASAQRQRKAILAGMLPHLAESNPEVVFRYTMGSGSVGLEREAYAAGYWVVEQLRRDGMSLAQIARVPEADMPAVTKRAVERLLASGKGLPANG